MATRSKKRLKKRWSLCLRLSESDSMVEQFMAEGGNINVIHSKTTLLCEACRCDQIDKVQFLLEKGSDIDQVDDSGSSPLFIATAHGNKQIVDLLISKGSDFNRPNKNRYTPLLIALQNDQFEIAKKLILAGANVNTQKPAAPGFEFDADLLIMVLVTKQHYDLGGMIIKAGRLPVKFFPPIAYILLEESGLPLDTAKLMIAAGFDLYVDCWVNQIKRKDADDVTKSERDLLDLLVTDRETVCSLQSQCRVVIRSCIVKAQQLVHQRLSAQSHPWQQRLHVNPQELAHNSVSAYWDANSCDNADWEIEAFARGTNEETPAQIDVPTQCTVEGGLKNLQACDQSPLNAMQMMVQTAGSDKPSTEKVTKSQLANNANDAQTSTHRNQNYAQCLQPSAQELQNVQSTNNGNDAQPSTHKNQNCAQRGLQSQSNVCNSNSPGHQIQIGSQPINSGNNVVKKIVGKKQVHLDQLIEELPLPTDVKKYLKLEYL